jgi:hypothetical protein
MRFAGAHCIISGSMQINRRKLQMRRSTSSRQGRPSRLPFRHLWVTLRLLHPRLHLPQPRDLLQHQEPAQYPELVRRRRRVRHLRISCSRLAVSRRSSAFAPLGTTATKRRGYSTLRVSGDLRLQCLSKARVALPLDLCHFASRDIDFERPVAPNTASVSLQRNLVMSGC